MIKSVRCMDDDLSSARTKMQIVVEQIESGVYRIPVFQRSYVWKKDQIVSLLDSIFHNYPIGTLLLVSNSGELSEILESRCFYGVEENGKGLSNCDYLVLDGQQRLTSCYHVFLNKGRTYRYFIDLKKLYAQWSSHSDNTDAIDFVACVETGTVSAKTDSIYHNLLPFSLIVTRKSFDVQRQAYIDRLKNAGENKEFIDFVDIELSSLIDPFINYNLSAWILPKGLKISAICRIFETLNSTGVKLDSFDICVARFMRDGINIKKMLEDASINTDTIGVLTRSGTNRDVNKNREVVLQVIALKNKVDHKKNSLAATLTYSMIKNDWNIAIDSIDQTMQILDIFGAGTKESMDMIPYPAIIPAIAAALIGCDYKHMSGEMVGRVKTKIGQYFYASAFNQRFIQGAMTAVGEDSKVLTEWFSDRGAVPNCVTQGITWVNDLMRGIKGRSGGAISSAIRCLMNKMPPCDFYSSGSEKIKAFDKNVDLHHIFPDSEYRKKYGNDIDSIFNMAFILKTTNINIRSDSTARYAKKIIDSQMNGSEQLFVSMFKHHLISEEGYRAFINEDYDSFIKLRMEEFVRELRDVIRLNVQIAKKADVSEDMYADMVEDASDMVIDVEGK